MTRVRSLDKLLDLTLVVENIFIYFQILDEA
jgi:hypothetical protein